jgi:hypothetical protein
MILLIASLFIILTGIFLGLFNKKSTMLLVISLLVIIYIFVNAVGLPDQEMYELQYSTGITNIDSEVGFRLLIEIGNKIGLTFFQFKLSLYIICFSLVYIGCRRYIKNGNYILSLYMLGALSPDLIQIRYFIATSIFIYAFHFLVEKSKYWFLKYCLCILVAATVHITSIFFLLFLLIRKRNFDKIAKWIFGLGITLSVISIIFGNRFTWIQRIMESSIEDVRIEYYSQFAGEYGFLLDWFLITYMILLMLWATKVIRRSINAGINKESKQFITSIYSINTLMIIIFPFLVLSNQYIRLFRSTLFLSILALTLLITLAKFQNKNERLLFNLATFIFFILFFFIKYFFSANQFIYPLFNL